MAISARQRCHYAKLTQQHAARTDAIRALVRLSRFPEDSEAAVRCLRLLDATAGEVEAEANRLMGQGDAPVRSISVGTELTPARW